MTLDKLVSLQQNRRAISPRRDDWKIEIRFLNSYQKWDVDQGFIDQQVPKY